MKKVCAFLLALSFLTAVCAAEDAFPNLYVVDGESLAQIEEIMASPSIHMMTYAMLFQTIPGISPDYDPRQTYVAFDMAHPYQSYAVCSLDEIPAENGRFQVKEETSSRMYVPIFYESQTIGYIEFYYNLPTGEMTGVGLMPGNANALHIFDQLRDGSIPALASENIADLVMIAMGSNLYLLALTDSGVFVVDYSESDYPDGKQIDAAEFFASLSTGGDPGGGSGGYGEVGGGGYDPTEAPEPTPAGTEKPAATDDAGTIPDDTPRTGDRGWDVAAACAGLVFSAAALLAMGVGRLVHRRRERE